jgi:hypothetical protein
VNHLQTRKNLLLRNDYDYYLIQNTYAYFGLCSLCAGKVSLLTTQRLDDLEMNKEDLVRNSRGFLSPNRQKQDPLTFPNSFSSDCRVASTVPFYLGRLKKEQRGALWTIRSRDLQH